jgi:hypothetical protein
MGLFKLLLEAANETGDSREEHRKLRRCWQEVAQRRGGQYEEQKQDLFGPSQPLLDVTVDGVAVHVDVFSDDVGNHTVVSTRFRGKFLLSSGPSFKVFYSRLSKIFGSADGEVDVELGYRRFDEHFMVHTSDIEGTRVAWSRDTSKRMLRFLSTGRVESDGKLITLTLGELVKNGEVLDAGIDVVSGVGRWGVSVLDEARRLAGARWIEAQGSWDARRPPSVRVDVLGVEVEIIPRIDDGDPTLAVRGTPERRLRTFDLELNEESVAIPDFLEEVDTASTRAALTSIGRARMISTGDQLRIELRGTPSTRRLDAATRLGVELARTPHGSGAYR